MTALFVLVSLAALQGDELLISTNELASMQDVLVVDARPRDLYTAAHIPGAASMDVDSLSENRGSVSGLLRPLPEVRRSLSQAGIDPSKHIVVYSELDSAADFKTATRLFWILEYVGYERVSILDGGFAKWKAEGRDTAQGPSTVEPVKIPKLSVREDRLATIKEVQAAIESESAALADLRSPEYYSGEKKAEVTKEAGRIPSASNIPADDFVSESDRTVKSWEELQGLMQQGGVSENEPVITYCNTGRSASVGYFVLRRMGNENVSLYDGSMSEWTAKRKDVETSPAGAK
ncbi:MAG: sulfurtransferase [Candidatus Hydrogenedentes bacterium]|nr:sulfurtransferase [Candidatus Hydrogenedentota bacterium]